MARLHQIQRILVEITYKCLICSNFLILKFYFQETDYDDDLIIKFSKILIEKNLRLIDLLRILDRQSKNEITKEDFINRLKVIQLYVNKLQVFYS